ncbi:GDSL esterase/lipase At2g23540-like [Triticum urartu]|uniref:GDSL esterase/lipase n=1 Tax=Triticum urartu TaxID=4572 RepID=A0A8R7TDQ4_TRIUA|nr:GDSL esterase/lipase At2g23540-like [Triticum urartu]
MGRMGSAVAVAVVAVLCAAAVVRVRGEDTVDEDTPGASFIFGDSLVDAGNNNYLSTLSKADMNPNGIDFAASGGTPTGRFTNGRTIADIIGEMLGQADYSPPFLAPNTTGGALLNGVNYASGGAGILNGTGRVFVNRIGMDVQVDYFNITRRELDGLLGKEKAREFIHRKAIFSITVGSNDFLNNYLMPVLSAGTRVAESPDGFIDDLIIHLREQLTRLHALGARKFVVANVGPLGCIPYQKTLNRVKDDECVKLPNTLAAQYNGRLRDLLIELNGNGGGGLPGGRFLLANVYDLVMELIANHRKYGFSTASVACCGNGGRYAGIVPCGPTSSMCDDRENHVFWDPYHPSEKANVLLAKYIVDGDSKYISPMNLRKLFKL